MKMLEPKIGKITYASWRNKFDYGWHDSWLMGMEGEKTAKPIDWHDSYNFFIMGGVLAYSPGCPKEIFSTNSSSVTSHLVPNAKPSANISMTTVVPTSVLATSGERHISMTRRA